MSDPQNPPPPAPAAAAPAVKTVKARLLSDCEHGKCNDLVEIEPDLAKRLEKAGVVDTDKAAVAYAAKLPQNQPKPKDADPSEPGLVG